MKPALVLDLDETLISSSMLRPSSGCLMSTNHHHPNHHRSTISSSLKRQSVPNISKLVQKIEKEDHDINDIDFLIQENTQFPSTSNSDFQTSSDDNFESSSQSNNDQVQKENLGDDYNDMNDQSVCFTIKYNRRRIYIMTRPGLHRFYSSVKALFDVYFFTSSERKYADQIINYIDDQVPQERRFFRDSCISFAGYYVKDLSILNRDLRDVILVDDTEGCALRQPGNLLRISPWFGCSFSPSVESQPSVSLLAVQNKTALNTESPTNINESSNTNANTNTFSSFSQQQLRRKSYGDVKTNNNKKILNKGNNDQTDNELNGRILPILIKFSQDFHIRHSMDKVKEMTQYSQISHQRDNELDIPISAI